MTSLPPHAHIHCIGIGGFGINPIARVLHEMGYTVSGCDGIESALIAPARELGIRIDIGHDPAHLTPAPDALLISSALPADHPEVQAALAANIPVYKRSEFLGLLMENRTGIAIAGTHGKTTTTSMLAWVLAQAGLEPSFIIGGVSKDLATNARAGQGAAFVIEADEYDRMFMGLKPRIIVLTSLEMDHPDMFEDLEAVRSLFREFVALLPDDGLLIGCVDDREVAKMVGERQDRGLPAIGYGQDFAAEWNIVQIDPNEAGGSSFRASFRQPDGDDGGFLIGGVSVDLRLPGLHNAQNALAALMVADHLGVDLRVAADALGQFTGTGRRFEVKGEAGGVTVIDDYAHHPTAIKATLAAARSRYGDRPIRAVWQPHTYRRTKALLAEFAASFGDAEHVIITDIYKSRDTHDYGVSVQDVLDHMSHPDARHIGSLDAVTEYLAEHVQPGDVVIIMSAGDATKIGERLLNSLRSA
jgi:UDP-N-acetylmuramate--alanine ligase